MATDPGHIRQARGGLFTLYQQRAELVWVQVRGTSMRPLLAPGSWVQVQFGTQTPRPGEIVVFRLDGLIVVHRVLSVGDQWLRVKGDGGRTFDPPLARHDVLGVVQARRSDPTGVPRTLGCRGVSARLAAGLSDFHGRAFGRIAARGMGLRPR